MLVDDAGRERFVGFGERLQGGEHVWISCGRLRGAEFGDGEGDGGKKLRMDSYEIWSQSDIKKRCIGGELARVLLFIAMRG